MEEADDSKLKEEVKGTQSKNITKEKYQKEIKESYKKGIEYYKDVEEEIKESKN